MNIELKAMACLLVYPRQQLFDELDEISSSIQNAPTLSHKVKENLSKMIEHFSSSSLANLQGIYVSTFALLSIANVKPEKAELTQDDLTPTLDAEWQDQPVTFGGGANPVEQPSRFVKK